MKSLIHKIHFILLLAISTAATAFTQPTEISGHVSGTLLDEQGKPMMFATASLINAKDSTLVKGAISNENGVYTFEHVKEGNYIVKVSTVGYQNAVTRPFTINQSSEEVDLPKITMQPAS